MIYVVIVYIFWNTSVHCTVYKRVCPGQSFDTYHTKTVRCNNIIDDIGAKFEQVTYSLFFSFATWYYRILTWYVQPAFFVIAFVFDVSIIYL